MNKAKIFAFIILLSLSLTPILSKSLELVGWNESGIKISRESSFNPQICSDGEGGAIIIWEYDYFQTDIYAQRIDSNGIIQWASGGIEICTSSDSQDSFQVCSDGEGGAIIVWEDERNFNMSNTDIYAQRINSNGIIQWMSNGIEICTVNCSQKKIQIISDGTGGAIITWQDLRKSSNYDIYAQKIDKNGNILWNPNGTEICTSENDQIYPQISSDDEGGAIVVWQDDRFGIGPDIYVQKINSSGIIQWDINGKAICIVSGWQGVPQIINNEIGGAILVWMDNRSLNDYDIYIQKINSSGSIKWNINGKAVCSTFGNQGHPQIVSDGGGGAIISWLDFLKYGTSIMAQRINSNGNRQWVEDGVTICWSVSISHQICSDGAGGAIITWDDFRNDDVVLCIYEHNIDIYAQKIDSYGRIKWSTNGLAICTEYEGQSNPQLVSDGKGGAIITWRDGRLIGLMDSNIYAQRTIVSNYLETPIDYFIMLIFLISIISIALILIIFPLILRRRMLLEKQGH